MCLFSLWTRECLKFWQRTETLIWEEKISTLELPLSCSSNTKTRQRRLPKIILFFFFCLFVCLFVCFFSFCCWVKWLLNSFLSKDASNDKRAVQKLRRKVEDAKKGISSLLFSLCCRTYVSKNQALSTQHQVDIEIDSFHEGKDFSWKLTRAKFEELNIDLFKKTLEPVKVLICLSCFCILFSEKRICFQNVLSDAKLQKSDVAEIVLVGGSTRIPKGMF